MNKKIVVLMSVYKKDDKEHLKLSIESILNQTYKNVCLLIGADGVLGEELGKTLSGYEGNEKVKIFWFPENRGLAAVLNDLLDVSKKYGAEYMARMDADDIAKPHRFEKQIKFLEENTETDVVGGAIEEINDLGEPRNKVVRYPLTHDECFKFFAARDPLAHPAVMFRKSFFEKATSYNTKCRKNQDTELWYRGFKNGCKFANLDDVVLSFRVSDDLYKRRGGVKFAWRFFKLRVKVICGLGYGIKAWMYAFGYFCMAISPSWMREMAYKYLR